MTILESELHSYIDGQLAWIFHEQADFGWNYA